MDSTDGEHSITIAQDGPNCPFQRIHGFLAQISSYHVPATAATTSFGLFLHIGIITADDGSN